MSRLQARRTLAREARNATNWRFRGLLAAQLDRDISARDMARAWPSPSKQSDYRFLKAAENTTPEKALEMGGVQADEGSDLGGTLKLADNADTGNLFGSSTIEQEDKTLSGHKDDVIKRTLFAGASPEEVDTLFRNELRDVVIAGAETRKIARQSANVINSPTPRGDQPVASDDEFAPEVAQGAEIRDSRERYDTVSYDTTKFGQGARVTDEMIDTSNIDAIERQIGFVGKALENSINRVWLDELVDNANEDVTRNGSADDPGYDALNRAYGAVDENDFRPDSFVTHPTFRTELYSDNALRFANRAGSDETVRDRVFDPLLDMEHTAASGRTYDGAGTWGYTNTDDIGAVAYDSENIHVVMYSPSGQDIEIKDYDDPIRDLQGVNGRIFCDAIYTQQRSAATVSHN